jgi:hypothetical protein
MAWADNFIAFHGRTAQDRTIVSANILDREKFAIDIEDSHQGAVKINRLPSARDDINRVCNNSPVTHAIQMLIGWHSNRDNVQFRVDSAYQPGDPCERS